MPSSEHNSGYPAWCDFVIPVELRGDTSSDALGLWLAWQSVLGRKPQLAEGSWLPIGRVGAILLMGHKNTPLPCDLPGWAVQRVRLHSSDYDALVEKLGAQLEKAAAHEAQIQFDLPDQPADVVPDPGLDITGGARFVRRHFPLTPDEGRRLEAFIKTADPKDIPSALLCAVRYVLTKTPVISPAAVKASLTVKIPTSAERPDAWPFAEFESEATRLMYAACGPAKNIAETTSYQSTLAAELRQAGHRFKVVLVFAPEQEISAVRSGKSAPASEALSFDHLTAAPTTASQVDASALVVREEYATTISPNKVNISGEELLKWAFACAIVSGGNDIHIELEGPNAGQVRVRVDGILRVIARLRIDQLALLKTEAINAAGKDVSANWKPQDGRLNITWTPKKSVAESLNVRFSSYPNKGTAYPTITMRLLYKNNRSLEDLMLTPFEEYAIKAAAQKKVGLMLVCGPTGSGKSSTLNSAIRFVHRPGIKIITAEDPIEYEIDGVTQAQVDINRKVDDTRVLNFATCVRSMLRQDFNIALIGELRDEETAGIAVEVANTGHNVMATLHSNDAPLAISRLRELGIRPMDIAETLTVVIAQRLIGKACSCCSIDSELTEAEKQVFVNEGVPLPTKSILRAAKNTKCEECGGTGVKGRVLIMEILPNNREIAAAIAEDAPLTRLNEIRRKYKYPTLLASALRRVHQRRVTIEEALVFRDIWTGADVPDPSTF